MNQYRYDISKKKKARAGEIRLIFWIFVPSDRDGHVTAIAERLPLLFPLPLATITTVR